MRTSFNLNSMYLTGASPLPPETRLSSCSVSLRSLFATASYEVSLVLLMIFLHLSEKDRRGLIQMFHNLNVLHYRPAGDYLELRLAQLTDFETGFGIVGLARQFGVIGLAHDLSPSKQSSPVQPHWRRTSRRTVNSFTGDAQIRLFVMAITTESNGAVTRTRFVR